jgi:putative colanic acid biosynthesis acetyltransferase WcaF
MMPTYQDLSKFCMPRGFRGRSIFIVQLWWFVQATFFRLSPLFLYEWRSILLRIFGAKIGNDVRIRPTTIITYPWHLSVGNHCWIGDNCTLYNLGKISIGNNVALAHNVYLCTGMHDFQKVNFPIYSKDITIEDEVWLPNDVFVGPGVTVGKGTVVGARSTVLHDLPGGMVCYGNPAEPIKPRVMKET